MTRMKWTIAVLASGLTMHALAAPGRVPAYIAESVTEHIQTLADGNQVVYSTRERNYQDSSGRVRREMYDAKGTLNTVFIMDGARNTFVLTPARKTLYRTPAPQDGNAARVQQGGAVPQLVVSGVTRADGSATQVKVAGADSGNVPHWAKMVGDVLGDSKYSANRSTKQLGLRFFEGVQAEGTLVSYEIPAGAQGNRRPITVSMESWTGKDLPLTMYFKSSDPRSGDFITRVTSVRREEPSGDLFEAPSDYTVVERAAYMLAPVEKKP